MSGNHNQSLGQALAIVEAAAQPGRMRSLQTYTADTMTLDVRGGSLRSMIQILLGQERICMISTNWHTLLEWHAPIMQRAHELGLICFSSPFDETAVEFLEELDVPAFKITSFENCHIPLIKRRLRLESPNIQQVLRL